MEEKRPHKVAKAGVSAQKKKDKKLAKMTEGEKKKAQRNNPKAFVAQTRVAAKQHYQYTQTRIQEKLHVPIMDRSVEDPPPTVIVVCGPPGCGKTTFIQALVKTYTKQNLKDVNGPITLITGKHHRITLIECPNDLNGMLDCAKIADVAVMLIDASYGFEMNTFEFIGMLQAQGFPKVIGCLTHLDKVKNNKLAKKAKKTLKKRFWRETYAGAKLFNLSGITHGSYPKTEIKIIARHLAVIKTRPIIWRSNHSYLVADRVEDLTEPQDIAEDPDVDRTVALYGYVRGTNMRPNAKVCIPGLGDYRIKEIEQQPDPCPFGDEAKRLKARTQTVFAPMCDVGGMRYDKDAVYVTMPTSLQNEREDQSTVQELVQSAGGITAQLNQSINIIDGKARRPVEFKDEIEEGDDSNDNEDDEEKNDMSEENEEEIPTEKMEEEKEEAGEIEYAEEGLDAEDEKKKWGMIKLKKRRDLMKEIYEEVSVKEEESDDDDDLLRPVAEHSNNELDLEDNSKVYWEDNVLDSLIKNEVDENIAKHFVSKSMRIVDDMIVDMDVKEEMSEDDDHLDDLIKIENGEVKIQEEKKKKISKEKKEQQEGEEETNTNPFWDHEETYMQKVQKQMQEQNKMNHEAFAELDSATRIQVEGAIAGTYVRIVIENVPAGFIRQFNPKRILLVGGVLRSEEQLTVMQALVLKHRWFPKLVKSKEPIVVSVGWRRYQTIATFSMEDLKGKQRMLKYTPKGVFCLMTFYGPACPSNSGIIAFETGEETPYYRPCLTGNISNVDKACEIYKKLKLVGQPKEIKKNTSFIKGMFNSRIEVSKFIGAKLQTVSGIRGQIKKAVPKDPGVFRATFESKLVPSDIVFLKGWIPVKINKFYNPMTDLTGYEWDRMRLSRELRKDHNLELPKTKDSSKYKQSSKPKLNENHEQKLERLEREKKKLFEEAENSYHVTKKIMRSLPFEEQLKIMEEGPKLKKYEPKKAN
ncbi:ribosome biogenesis protein bms1, putative [Entamoeba histolytica HM-1:IMSS-B]|uniref:Ribosome biogenesis protein BMS1, putative n=5 Tax=Entamoeba histolytica TaxID=5759 RepID=C4M9R3_ENTH1|nr:Ribosome biogenesis protein BMS1, putative [Entamoeba histolytica HM-1:IMSS]EMD42607.1 ribosome biogenesis protein BMS1, putative [Entamoeba histolytica KU27]EMH77402.1 ribosome biogenesis protein bms1, putative [Entamoeba histolytica HM-1:IMSS-B]ENY62058.1 ribosome biogenesis protein BMS1, putative [Entamoeba histolytica HM-1:IMSS-A]GAT98443.1 ribosome biogenesis protein bms1 putative [Entamoeba histolytica]EAL44084.1 Ribosome biogenesis protein BMS1, putative [Entamoeba histolytica HM-1:I|eukprot:XP_649470.1 Ribosome biogenesis protein BMS1, putative [Entamoeba histolytica HM-1:IMSS]